MVVGKAGWVSMCNKFVEQNVFSIATVDVSYDATFHTAIWHLAFNFGNHKDGIFYINTFNELTLENENTTPNITQWIVYDAMSAANDSNAVAIEHNYATQYYKNCTQWLGYFSTSALWYNSDGVTNYTQMVQGCPSSWAGVTSFMFTAMVPIMVNQMEGGTTKRYLVSWQFQQTQGDAATVQVERGNGRTVYMFDSNSLVTYESEYFPTTQS
jgi:hypothetical protein